MVAGDESGEPALELATEVARGMGRTPIRARDSVGFVANRCVRPFFLESLRMLGEGSRRTTRSTGSSGSAPGCGWAHSS